MPNNEEKEKKPVPRDPFEALHFMADKRTDDGKVIAAEFDATYHDRDGNEYPAHIQHLEPHSSGRESEPLFRVYVNADNVETVFKVSHHEAGRESAYFWKLHHNPDGTHRQEKISAEAAKELCADCQEYKCLLYLPKSMPHVLAADSHEPYAQTIKIPVVDLIVNFSTKHTIKLNHVGNVRPARHAVARIGETRMPCYSVKREPAAKTPDAKK